MSALWIAHVTVTDEDAYAKYAAIATEAIAPMAVCFWRAAGATRCLKGRIALAMWWPVFPASKLR